MKKNVIISPTGNQSFFKRWVGKNDNFDLVLLYYEDDNKTFNQLTEEGFNLVKCKGEKWDLIKDFLLTNKEYFELYDNFWFPDDDLLIDPESINRLFNIHSLLKLWLSQPSLFGYIAHEVTRHDPRYFIRYTNFVEIMCPLMSCDVVKYLINTFGLSESMHGADFLWPKMLGFAKDRIAVIDNVQVFHTRKVGADYGRFKSKLTPGQQMDNLKKMFSINHNPSNIQGIRV